ncbi:MAG TPA: TIGR03435 family protein [Bryobacteraceae bacterium]|jgi:uncharacterized protein (TIGR03435 family)
MRLAIPAVATLACTVTLFAATPEFEVATVKPLDQVVRPGEYNMTFLGAAGKLIKINGNRVTITNTLRFLIGAAYDLKDYQITGAPGWADTAIFAVTAKTEGDAVPTQDEVRPMLQALLEERFQLKIRHETKELPVYHLVPTKKGVGLTPAGPDETFGWKVTSDKNGAMHSKATKEWMGDFVQLVAISTDRPVVNKSGVTGYIDYEIVVGSQDLHSAADQNRGIIDAVQEQLGLRLEPAKDPVELLVVEHAELPSEN